MKKVLDHLSELIFPPEVDLRDEAKLSQAEVVKIAQDFGGREEWVPAFTQKEPCLKKEGNKLVWVVHFGAEQEEEVIMIGQHRFITIDDETREVKSFVGPR